MRKYIFILPVILTAFSACGPSRKATDKKADAIFNEWINQPKSQLVEQLGKPDSIISDGKNGEVLIYKERVGGASVMNGNYTGRQYSFRKEMFVNADSVIYYWKAWRRK